MTKIALTKRNRRSLRSKTLRSQKGGGFFDNLKKGIANITGIFRDTKDQATANASDAIGSVKKKLCPESENELAECQKKLAECRQGKMQKMSNEQVNPGDKIGVPTSGPTGEASVMIGGKKRKRRRKKSKKRKRKNKKKTRRRRR